MIPRAEQLYELVANFADHTLMVYHYRSRLTAVAGRLRRALGARNGSQRAQPPSYVARPSQTLLTGQGLLGVQLSGWSPGIPRWGGLNMPQRRMPRAYDGLPCRRIG